MSTLQELTALLGIDPSAPIRPSKIVFTFPFSMGRPMVTSGQFQAMADGLSNRFLTTIWVHYGGGPIVGNNSYRIGQVVDIEDCRDILGAFLVHRAVPLFPHFQPLPLHQLPVTTPQGSAYFAALVGNAGLPPNFVAAPIPITQSAQASAPIPAPAPAPAPTQRARVSSRSLLKVPKPRNSWIIYRQSKHSLVARENPEMHTSQISQVISKMWRDETPAVKSHFAHLAEEEKNNHVKKHPGYKCSPRKSSQIKKRKTSKQRNVDSQGTAPVNASTTDQPSGNAVVIENAAPVHDALPEQLSIDDMVTAGPTSTNDDRTDIASNLDAQVVNTSATQQATSLPEENEVVDAGDDEDQCLWTQEEFDALAEQILQVSDDTLAEADADLQTLLEEAEVTADDAFDRYKEAAEGFVNFFEN